MNRGGETEEGIDWQIADWLKNIEEEAALVDGSSSSSKPYNKILAYCIEKDPYRDWLVLTMRVGTVKKSGEVSVERTFASADLARPPKYMAIEDFGLVARLRKFERENSSYGGLRFKGNGFGKFLEDILATGRLFVVKKMEKRYTLELERVKEEGPPESIKAVWEQLEN